MVVLGDPGPWICAGMTGGVIYQCLYPEFGFVRQSLVGRLARSADVTISHVNKEGINELQELLGKYIAELEGTFQFEEAQAVKEILQGAADRFLMIKAKPLRPLSAE